MPTIHTESTGQPTSSHLFVREDLYFLGAAAGGFALAATGDRWLTSEAVENQGIEPRHQFADLVQPLPVVAMAAAAGLYVYGTAFGQPGLAGHAERVGISMLVAGGVTLGLKEVVGRWRPDESPDDPFHFDPFSGHNSFPSGHTTVAFAAAVAIDRETTSRWVPWLVYPAAGLVGWSRVHELKHWASDVVAGAALGSWTAWKTESFFERRSAGASDTHERATFHLEPVAGTIELVVTRPF